MFNAGMGWEIYVDRGAARCGTEFSSESDNAKLVHQGVNDAWEVFHSRVEFSASAACAERSIAWNVYIV